VSAPPAPFHSVTRIDTQNAALSCCHARDGRIMSVSNGVEDKWQVTGKVRGFSVILMLAAVTGATAQVVGAILELGRAAGW
jgi:hypothetical protein